MAASGSRKQLALDTNLVLDLARREDFAFDLKETSQSKGYVLRLPPTAAAELHENFAHGQTAADRELAQKALLNIRRWGIQPIDLADIEQATATRFAQHILQKGLLPAEEFHDAVILAESSVAAIPLLVTSDKHLLDIEEALLVVAFQEFDLTPVHVVHPKRLLRALT